MEDIWKKISAYTTLTEEGKAAWDAILRKKVIKKNDFFISEGQVPRSVAFVAKGLFSQYHTVDNGDVVIKRFFPETYFLASASAMLQKTPSIFTIKALEDSIVLEYNFDEFKKLTAQYPDIATFYIRYMEIHWVIQKEPLEISLRYDPAKTKYADFQRTYPGLETRIKQHEIASYLGITPTQLSRIRNEE